MACVKENHSSADRPIGLGQGEDNGLVRPAMVN
jgi:hypothetical protein